MRWCLCMDTMEAYFHLLSCHRHASSFWAWASGGPWVAVSAQPAQRRATGRQRARAATQSTVACGFGPSGYPPNVQLRSLDSVALLGRVPWTHESIAGQGSTPDVLLCASCSPTSSSAACSVASCSAASYSLASWVPDPTLAWSRESCLMPCFSLSLGFRLSRLLQVGMEVKKAFRGYFFGAPLFPLAGYRVQG